MKLSDFNANTRTEVCSQVDEIKKRQRQKICSGYLGSDSILLLETIL